MRRLFVGLFLLFAVTPCMANIKLKADVVTAVMKQYIPQDKLNGAIREYNAQLKASQGVGISAAKLWNVCVAAGWDIKTANGKKQCKTFVDTMVRSSTIRYYAVCGKDKNKSRGKEYCIDDVFTNAFYGGVQVQIMQAVELCKEYARVVHGDSSVQCSSNPREGILDDMIRCASRDKNTFYEFVFDDVKETGDVFISDSVLNAICKIHGVKYLKRGMTPATQFNQSVVSWTDACEVSDKAKCDSINITAKKLAYNAYLGDRLGKTQCLLDKNGKTNKDTLRTKYGIDNMYFRKSGVQLNAKMHVKDQIKQYVTTAIAPTKLEAFKCDANYVQYYDYEEREADDLLTCYVNGYPVDFVFNDLSESWGVTSKAGEQGMSCIISGGTYDGKRCLHLDKAQCEQLKKSNAQTCPECSSVYWNEKDGLCELPSSANGTNLQKGIVMTGIVVGAAAGVVITVMTGGTGAAALTIVAIETTGAAIELGAQVEINKAADEFLLQSRKCNDATCAEKLVGEHFQRLANMTNDLSQAEEFGIDQEMARLLNLIPDDSEFFQKVLAEGTTLAEREKGFFDPESWEPEQVWRAIGITLQLTSLFTSVGKWISTKAKTVITTMDEATDVARSKLTRAQAKALDDMPYNVAHVRQQRQATGLGKARADELWARQQDWARRHRTLLNKLGNPPQEVLPLLQREAFIGDDLAKAQDELADIIRQQDNLYMTNKNGQQVLRPGNNKYRIADLDNRRANVMARIQDYETELAKLDEEINAMLGAGKQVRTVETVTTIPGHTLDDGIATSARLGKLGIAEVKNQTRKEYDNMVSANVKETDERVMQEIVVPDGVGEKPIDTNIAGIQYSDGTAPVLPSAVAPMAAPKVEPKPEVEQKPEVAPNVEPEPEVEPKPETKPEVAPNAEPEPEVEPKPEVETKPETPTPVYQQPEVYTPTTPTPVRKVEAPKAEKKKSNTGLIATAAVLGAVGTGFLIGGLVGKDDKDDKKVTSSLVPNQMEQELDTLMRNAAGAFGFVTGNALKLVPLPTTQGTMAPIVLIGGRAVAVVDYRGHRLPYWVNSSSARWEPLLGIGQNGGWFNAYPNPSKADISFVDTIAGQMNTKLSPKTVLYFAGPNASGTNFPDAHENAYPIINTEFPNGVVQSIDGGMSPADQMLYNNNYNRIKNLFNTAQFWAVFL